MWSIEKLATTPNEVDRELFARMSQEAGMDDTAGMLDELAKDGEFLPALREEFAMPQKCVSRSFVAYEEADVSTDEGEGISDKDDDGVDEGWSWLEEDDDFHSARADDDNDDDYKSVCDEGLHEESEQQELDVERYGRDADEVCFTAVMSAEYEEAVHRRRRVLDRLRKRKSRPEPKEKGTKATTQATQGSESAE
jgi:hypothetical protein